MPKNDYLPMKCYNERKTEVKHLKQVFGHEIPDICLESNCLISNWFTFE